MTKTAKQFFSCFALFAILFPLLIILPSPAKGETAEELQIKIDERNKDIKDLEAEITKYQTELDTTSKESQSLKTAIKNLDILNKQLSAQIKVTENKISAANLNIEQLSAIKKRRSILI
jgi:peptidoglycan hydrolase CwlO-like protein